MPALPLFRSLFRPLFRRGGRGTEPRSCIVAGRGVAALASGLLVGAGCGLTSSGARPPTVAHANPPIRETIATDQSFFFAAGDVLAGEPLRHVFQYRNADSVPLRHAPEKPIHTTCGCTRVQLNRHHLAPGETAELSIEIETANRLGDLSESATVTWYTQSGEPRTCQFTLTGRVRSAFAMEPPELTFTKAELRAGKLKTVSCHSDLPIDWSQVQIAVDESYVYIDSRHFDEPSGRLLFSVGCRPTHRGDHRRTAIRISGSTPKRVAAGIESYHAVLPVYSHDFAALRVSPSFLVLAPQSERAVWNGYLILTGDLLEAGTNLRDVAAEGCRVEFETVPLAPNAERVNLTLGGDVDSLPPDQRQLQLTFDNGLRQLVGYRLQSP